MEFGARPSADGRMPANVGYLRNQGITPVGGTNLPYEKSPPVGKSRGLPHRPDDRRQLGRVGHAHRDRSDYLALIDLAHGASVDDGINASR